MGCKPANPCRRRPLIASLRIGRLLNILLFRRPVTAGASGDQGANGVMSMRDTANLVLLALLGVAVLSFAWVGHIGSDDQIYLNAAETWLADGLVVGQTHWSNRLTLVLPLAGVIGLFGASELNSVLVTTAYFVALLALSYLFLRRFFGAGTGLAGTGLLLLTPLFAVQATIAGVDVVEAFFCAASLWLFLAAAESPRAGLWLFAAGLAAGLALLTRLTGGGLIIFYAILFLLGSLHPRRLYWVMAAGVAVVVGADALYNVIMTGDPLHRLNVAVGSHGGLGSIQGDFGAGSGNISDNRLLAPLLALLVNQEFGLLYFLAPPAAWMTARSRRLTDRQRRTVTLLAGFLLVWFLWIGYGGAIRPLPRYFSATTYVAVVLVAVWLVMVLPAWSRLFAGLVAAGLVASNLLCIMVENRDPLFGERALADYAASHGEAVHTDPRTARKADRFLAWAGVEAGRVRPEPPPAGSLFFHYPKNAATGATHQRARFDPALFAPGADWPEVARIEPAPRLLGILLSLFQLDRVLPPGIVVRLARPNPPAVVYRAPGAAD